MKFATNSMSVFLRRLFIKKPASHAALLWTACCLVVLATSAAPASAQFRVATYNIADIEGNQSSIRFVLEAISEDFAPDSGTVRAPDIFVFQEVDNSISNTILGWMNNVAPPGVTYVRGTYTTNGGGGENAVIYNSNTVVEDVAGHKDITNHTGPRSTDRWKFSIIGEFGGSLYVYCSHLKADTGSTNESRRASEVNAIRNDADSLGNGVNIIYAGDMNFKSSSEAGFQRFFDAGNGKAVDPRFNKSFGSTISHTQSPHDGSEGLVTGGMDDRFDFLLVSDELADGNALDCHADTYRSFGNDGFHFNKAINDGYNSYFLDSETSIKSDALAKASDHVPVVLDFFLSGDLFYQEVTRLEAGALGQWSALNAGSNKKVYFVYSTKGFGEFDVQSLNVTLRLQSPKLAATKTSNSNGIARVPVTPGANFAGIPVYLQAVKANEVSDVVIRIIE